MDLGFEIQKTNVATRINNLEITGVPILRQNKQLSLFWPNLPKNGFSGWNFKNVSPDSKSALPRCHVSQFSVKTSNFDFFGPNLPKKEIKS